VTIERALAGPGKAAPEPRGVIAFAWIWRTFVKNHRDVGTERCLDFHRFARPVAYQNFPQASLPPELQDVNPRGIWRRVDGAMTRDVLPTP
jgi:hypothetical protein